MQPRNPEHVVKERQSRSCNIQSALANRPKRQSRQRSHRDVDADLKVRLVFSKFRKVIKSQLQECARPEVFGLFKELAFVVGQELHDRGYGRSYVCHPATALSNPFSSRDRVAEEEMFSGEGVQVWQVGHRGRYHSGLETHMTRWMALSGIALAALLLAPSSGLACTCIDPGPFTREAYRNWLNGLEGAAFRGRVIAIEQTGSAEPLLNPNWKVTFQVLRHWKGVRAPEIVILTPVSGEACGMRFDLRRPYLVVAYRFPEGLVALGCNFYLEDERAFLRALGEGSPPPKK